MNLEDTLDAQTIVSRRASFLSLTAATPQRSGFERSNPSASDTHETTHISKFDFEDDLEASRVYSRAQRDTMDFSFRSSIALSHSWSVFSGLSLGDISIISVIALPIYQEDLSNAQHYDFGNNTVDVPEPPQPVIKKPLLVECLEIRHKMLRLPNMRNRFDAVYDYEEAFHNLKFALRGGVALVVLLQALDPTIYVDEDRVAYFPEPSTGLAPRGSLLQAPDSIAWFIKYCHDILKMEKSCLFTVEDLMGGSNHGFLKVC